jgi:serine/threonine protein kinase
MGKRKSRKINVLYFVFFKIVMEYCGAGSVSDIMKLRGKTVIIKSQFQIDLIFYSFS